MFRKHGQRFEVGTVLFEEGDEGTHMYVIHAGKIKLTRGKAAGRETILAILPAGEFFGEMAIVMNRPRTATATVVEPSRLLVLDSPTFETMVRGNAEIALRIIRKLATRLEASNRQVDILLRTEPNHRVVFALQAQAEIDGRPEGPGIRVDQSMADLAGRIGLDEDAVRDAVDKLAQAKLVTTVKGGFIIPQVGKLQDYLEFLEMREQFGTEEEA